MANSEFVPESRGDVHQSDCPPTVQPDSPEVQFGSILAANSADYASFAGFADS
jgi:hypothetical protein